MANSLLTISMINKEAMRLLHNNLSFTAGVNRQYDPMFAQEGAKIGSNLNIRIPSKYYVSSGANMVTQDHVQANVTLSVANQIHVGIAFTSKERTMDLSEYSDIVLKPAVARLATKIDQDGLALANQVYNSVGTPGTAPVANAADNRFVEASQKLKEFGCPQDNLRYGTLNPTAESQLLKYSTTLFNPNAVIGDQYRMGRIGRAYGIDWGMDQNTESLTLGTRANGVVEGANQTGANLVISGADANGTVVKGDSFTIANVYAVNPENQISTGALQQFVVTAAANIDANGDATLGISPSITLAAANVANGTVNALAANAAALTWIGAASAAARINVAYHRDAFVLGTADLLLPPKVEGAREVMDGISMRTVTDYAIANDTLPTRIDILYGWLLARPELACKIYG